MDLQIGDQVELLVEAETPLGYTVLINNELEGLLFRNEVYRIVEEGMEVKGYIKNIREDGKIDVSLRPQGFRNVIDEDVEIIYLKLKESKEGFLLLTDKSSSESIKFHLNMSKKAFKKAIGNLYKQKLIVLKDDRIELI
ncbi:MAG: DNA-binding protein [Flavobacteriia bacterium]|nr:DNA-binding protein [Flavobacteriia bacterium]OIP47275.1 MAG: DNA-binding protein [Flavobacteriaceae bacterium CG2_30_31_66]PIV96142.1 MAG: DNA-binding protein [Flavobacteriaceae bacterium CG17_big_fil_post_rev_8_21_14_2_50_31_13]PIX13812.1 MAG: DNA-binding protein [Flavobacteriaceae bacterium CG_4_8_14_3_um_filter_31_8]PIY14359.1 MAG: DNA-binding protein [Flavobacteriaceae bacterium CG_4_10_14_3_um_filter_31_253]PIZ10446.1 MAG: DNA-binding protein [Flavobacteriaceae bacterium CG_4_10_14_0_